MTVHDAFATLRAINLSRSEYHALSRVEAEVARLERERDEAWFEERRGIDPAGNETVSVWCRRCGVVHQSPVHCPARNGAAEAEVARLQDELERHKEMESVAGAREFGIAQERDHLRDGLRRIADQQSKTVDWLRANSIVFDDLDDHWQKVAFSIYNDLCEVDAWAHDLLGEGIDGKPRAALADQDGAA